MNVGKTALSQLMYLVPCYEFNKFVQHYQGNKKVRGFLCWKRFLCMAFAQLSARESLRDIEVTLNSHRQKHYHMGFRVPVARSTLADTNEKRDFRIYRGFAYALIPMATRLYRDEALAVDIQHELYALDSTTIDFCLSVFAWARFRKTKAAIKLQTQLDLRGSIPTCIAVSDGATHDVNLMDVIHPPADAIQVMHRGYLDF